MSFRYIFLILTVTLGLMSCGEGSKEPLLLKAADLASDRPEDALALLDSVDYEGLSEADRHFFDLLKIKASDKAYVTHISDSLYLETLDYYSRRPESPLYPEVLYYGGRVYSDLGDYPTSLGYFHKALDLLPENTDRKMLRSAVLSQTGRLLNTLRLYNQAAPYLESVIKINSELKDTVNMVYNLQLLGSIYNHVGDYDNAERCLKSALINGRRLPASFNAKSKMYLAGINNDIGKLDSALFYIDGVLDHISSLSRNVALSYASEIYFNAGHYEKAYQLSQELVGASDLTNKHIGFQILLSPQMANLISEKKKEQYVHQYKIYLDEVYKLNEPEHTIIQNALYNYQLHERERYKAEQAKTELERWMIGISVLVIVLVAVILFLRHLNEYSLLKLRFALANIALLRKQLNPDNDEPLLLAPNNECELSDENNLLSQGESLPMVNYEQNESELRKRLRDTLYSIYKENEHTAINMSILNSEVYSTIQEYVSENRIIGDKSELWKELERTVIACSPNFKSNLQLLTGGKITMQEWRTSLLIKCGFTPSQLVVLLGRTKGAISSRRESICIKVFDQKLGTKVIDGIIRLL